MRNLFSISRKKIAVLITLIILCSGALWYYMAFIPSNEEALNEQHFRWLQKIDGNIRAKIVANDTLLSNLLQAYIQDPSENNVEDYISNYYVPNTTLLAYKTAIRIDSGISIKDHVFKKVSGQIKNNQRDTSSIEFLLVWDSSTNKMKLSASKEKPDTDIKYNVSLAYDFEKFIKPLLTPGLFEHYVVFFEGNYIYEDFHSGLGYKASDEDSLLKTGKAMTGANIIDQKVGGVDYKIFFQPINFFGGKKLIIAGLLSQKQFNAEKKQLPPGIAVLAITVGIGILLFFPWIKIYFQGKYDKVNLKDAAESVIVAKLLISLIVSLFFTYNHAFRADNEEHSKEFLADSIGSAFTREVQFAGSCLQKFDSVMNRGSMFYDIIYLGTNTGKCVEREEDVFDTGKYHTSPEIDKLNELCSGLRYYEINWLDSSNGRVKYNWTKWKQNNIHANYKDRDYFKNALNNNNTISLEKTSANAIALDQIISRTSGTFRTIISKKSLLQNTPVSKENRAKVVTLSFAIKSLDSIIMPAGYSFAILDDNGIVRYHSKPERNLNESLLEEFSNSEELKKSLKGRFKEVFETQYYKDDYSVLVNPLKGLPYFIVIMSDQSFSAIVQIETFSFTWGMILVFMIIVALDLFILISASSRRSLFKKQYFVTSWLWPRSGSQNEYRIAGIGNSILIIALILIPVCRFPFFNYLLYLFLLIFCIPLSTIFINSLFLHKYRAVKNEVYQNYKVRCNIYSISFLVIINVFAILLLGFPSYWYALIFEVLAVSAGFMFFYFHKPRNNTNNNISSFKISYIDHFTLMIFTRLLITSVIPVVFFYTASYNFESNLLARYRQYDFVTQLKHKFPGQLHPDNPDYTHAIYPDSAWIKNVNNIKDSSCFDSSDSDSTNKENTASLFNFFGFNHGKISNVYTDNFYKSSSDDGYFCFNNFFDGALYGNKGNKLWVIRNIDNNTTKSHLEIISSQDLNYAFPSIIPYKGFMFWLLLMAAMFGFYCLLREVIKKVCSLNLEQIPLLKEMNETIHRLLINAEQPLTWITGVPTNEILKKIERTIDPNTQIPYLDFNKIVIDDKKYKDISLERLNEGDYLLRLKLVDEKKSAWDEMKSNVETDSGRFVFVLHIDSNLDDIRITAEKIDCIRSLLNKEKKIIIISGMHPSEMHEILNRKSHTGEMIPDATAVKLMDLIFNNSIVFALPLIENNYTLTDENNNEIAQVNNAIHLFLDEETKYTEFLKSLRPALLSQGIEIQTNKFREDRLTLRIQSLANNFYMSIWQSLSSDERFILYDLAADGLVNISNTFAVSLLINKGLIIEEEGHLHIFNRSFRNFIVSSIEDIEVEHMQLLNRRRSNWSNLQAPLLLIVLGIFVFLAIAQEGVYSKVIGIVSGIAAGIPALLKLLSVIGVQNEKGVKNE